MGQIWNTVIFEPMLNGLLFLYSLLGRNFGLSVIVFTVLVRVLTLPITMQQMRSAKASQDLQPKLQELQKKYKNDREKLAEEQMKLYKEAGVNPFGCLVPTLIQLPIWIGLYQSIINALPDNPLQLLNLARHIYQQFPLLSSLVPLNPRFLWLHLGRPDPYYVVPILVVATMWVQQKMMASPTADPQQQAMNQSMELMMPMMFGIITLQLASGLGLYFVATNLVGIIQQYFVSGWGALATLFGGRTRQA
ncbi:MAG: membrane protein insertase YidC, partial [Chloroflexi bacterium]|nr:membrane protein insertase YidC [Chloroflexota bacterium]